MTLTGAEPSHHFANTQAINKKDDSSQGNRNPYSANSTRDDDESVVTNKL